jgi:hypothetical protein
LLLRIGSVGRCGRSGHQNTPGEFVIDPPTLINLGFEWLIEGDDNRNATVEVAYRRAGEVEWRQGLPLLRLRLKPGSAAVDRGVVLYNVTDGFTGSAPNLGALQIGQAQPHYGPR